MLSTVSCVNDVAVGSRDPIKRAFARLCKSVKTPVSLAILGSSDFEKSKFKMPAPETYPDASSFSLDYLVVSYLSKYKGLKTGIDTEAVAIQSFAAAETACAMTNSRLLAHVPSIVDPVLYRAQRIVSRVLGGFSSSKLKGQERWGPGAASDLRRNIAHLDTKMAKLPISVTLEAAPLFLKTVEQDLHWSELILGVFPSGEYCLIPDYVVSIEDGSRIVTVDKNAKTDRTIAIEPRGNMFLQKSAGRYIRRRLKRFGIDLDNQEVNQNLARDALDLGLATIDLSMASDSICRQLIFELLPFDWAVYLNTIRSQRYTLNGELKTFEKFSSMGNGFTFELESLLFYALTRASTVEDDSIVSVYGDDIICKSSDAYAVITVLSFCGFSTNVDKTFVDGPFRESCGRHYFNGVDVTPVYQKEVITDLFSHIRFLNRLKRLAARRNDGDALCPIVNRVWSGEYTTVKHRWHPQLPLGSEGDEGYILAHSDIVRLPKYDRNYGYKWQVLLSKVNRIPANDRALLAYALRLGCITESPNLGDLDSLDRSAVSYARGTRWIEPTWEFSLES